MAAFYPADEKELLLLLATGDEKAFELIYHHYKDRIYSNLLKLLRSDELAEELLQEVFFKLWLNRAKLDKVESFSSYLYRMSANIVADFYRKAAFDKKLQQQLIYTTTELYDHIEDQINFKDSDGLIQQAIANLPPQRKLVFTLCKIEGKSYDEVSSLLGISTSTINDHIVKATRVIKKNFIGSQEAVLTIVFACLLHHRS